MFEQYMYSSHLNLLKYPIYLTSIFYWNWNYYTFQGSKFPKYMTLVSTVLLSLLAFLYHLFGLSSSPLTCIIYLIHPSEFQQSDSMMITNDLLNLRPPHEVYAQILVLLTSMCLKTHKFMTVR